MCASSSPFITLKLLKEIYTGDCFCPLTCNIRVHNVLHKPNSEQLVNIIVTTIENNDQYTTKAEELSYKRLAKHLKRAMPDRQWLLGLLGMMISDHEIF